jgi:hypothetical protein
LLQERTKNFKNFLRREKPHVHKHPRRNLAEQDRRNAEAEIPVARFMVKDAHAQKSTRAAEQQRECKECFFGDAARAGDLGAALIRAVDEKRDEIDRGEVKDKKSHFSSFASSTAAAAPRRALLKTS